MKKYLPLLILLIFSVNGCQNQNYVNIDNKQIIVETAKTQEEIKKGLMFRENLCDNCGMLFFFEKEDYHSFWMKNTFIPLDMVFIDADLNIVDVLHAVPCIEDTCQSYTPRKKALYVLETNKGKFNEKIIGEKVEIFDKDF